MADKKISQLPAATTPLTGTEVLPIVQSGVTDQVSVENLTAGRSVSASGLTLTDGSANGVTYLNASKALTAGTSLTFDGTTFQLIASGTTEFALHTTVSPIFTMMGGSGFSPLIGYKGTGLRFGTITGTGGAGFTEQLLLSSTGNLTVDTGNLVIGTSGKGIDFSVTPDPAGMTSELLADYEEGTWTPTQGAALTVVGTFSSSGKYTKIGRVVTVTAFLNATTSITTIAGGLACGGLPYSVSVLDVGSMTTNALTQSSSVSAYQTNLFSSSATSAATGLILTVTYTV